MGKAQDQLAEYLAAKAPWERLDEITAIIKDPNFS
jgi:hypothetical protein